MSDNRNLRGPDDAKRINIHEDYEVRYWCNKFGCTPEELRRAVNTVGVMADAVERHLRSTKRR